MGERTLLSSGEVSSSFSFLGHPIKKGLLKSRKNVENRSEDGRCYQLETTGPCVVPLVFNMRSTNGLTPQCSCPVDHVFHNESQKCYKEFTQVRKIVFFFFEALLEP